MAQRLQRRAAAPDPVRVPVARNDRVGEHQAPPARPPRIGRLAHRVARRIAQQQLDRGRARHRHRRGVVERHLDRLAETVGAARARMRDDRHRLHRRARPDVHRHGGGRGVPRVARSAVDAAPGHGEPEPRPVRDQVVRHRDARPRGVGADEPRRRLNVVLRVHPLPGPGHVRAPGPGAAPGAIEAQRLPARRRVRLARRPRRRPEARRAGVAPEPEVVERRQRLEDPVRQHREVVVVEPQRLEAHQPVEDPGRQRHGRSPPERSSPVRLPSPARSPGSIAPTSAVSIPVSAARCAAVTSAQLATALSFAFTIAVSASPIGPLRSQIPPFGAVKPPSTSCFGPPIVGRVLDPPRRRRRSRSPRCCRRRCCPTAP